MPPVTPHADGRLPGSGLVLTGRRRVPDLAAGARPQRGTHAHGRPHRRDQHETRDMNPSSHLAVDPADLAAAGITGVTSATNLDATNLDGAAGLAVAAGAASLAGLDATLQAVGPALDHRWAIVGPPPSSDGWIRASDLLDPERLDEALAVVREHHQATPEVAVSYFTAWYAATIVGPAIATFVLTRRVPDLDRAEIWVHRHEGGWFDATAFHRPRMTLLPGDPAVAGCAPEATPVEVVAIAADLEALRARLVEEIIGHLEPIIASLRKRARLGLAALWGAVAAQCGRTFLLTERVSRDPHLGRLEADAFFAAAAPTLRARPTWQQFIHRGRCYTGMRRGSCCLAHRITEEFCTACPFVAAPERESRLREWIDSQGPGGLAV